ncbi:LacI family DNA-binding transcriptional regulator [Oceaniovalibus sp. ACAM 378]|uniref:LacI family DNA-binding transcriptional regulator n=1 Tax=Oceaniovalibus sp. ACAM 378 TaxID=2599923 RepID=UPI0011D9B564|nr:LacI family DNA-binding transcriptional regulator [Oceaniovalibus sp. ACAM 378]TYB90148.1 LacI family transcriptional regulator [Oceaniovalibus sp. ACAM 378]
MIRKTKVQIRSLDVARLAGVSRSAVSRTYTTGAYVSEETRQKVLSAAEMLGYAPNALARSLITKRTGIVGIVSTDLDNPFYAALLQQLGTALQDAGLAPLLLFGDENSTDQQITQMMSYRVDALAMTNATLSSRMAARFAASDKPIVAINRYLAQEEITSITCDNADGAAKVVDHLVEIGCRKIAFVAGHPDASSSRDRESGFLRQMAQHGLSPTLIAVGDYTHYGGAEAARRILGAGKTPDAIACANDLMAFGVMDVARNTFGINIPGQLKVTGFDNSSLADWPSHALTSVDQNVAKMVQLAVALILAGITGTPQATPSHLQISSRLVLRASTIG